MEIVLLIIMTACRLQFYTEADMPAVGREICVVHLRGCLHPRHLRGRVNAVKNTNCRLAFAT